MRAVSFVRVVSLPRHVTFQGRRLTTTLCQAARVKLRLHGNRITVLIRNVGLTVVVRRRERIMSVAVGLIVHPEALNAIQSVRLRSVSISVKRSVRLSIIVTSNEYPSALSMDLLTVTRVRVVEVVRSIRTMKERFPVCRVLKVRRCRS